MHRWFNQGVHARDRPSRVRARDLRASGARAPRRGAPRALRLGSAGRMHEVTNGEAASRAPSARGALERNTDTAAIHTHAAA